MILPRYHLSFNALINCCHTKYTQIVIQSQSIFVIFCDNNTFERFFPNHDAWQVFKRQEQANDEYLCLSCKFKQFYPNLR